MHGKVKGPIIDEHGVRKFRVGEMRLTGDKPIVRLKQAKPYVPNASGALAAEIFTRLDRGEDVNKIVAELRVHPDVVLGISNTWERVAKGLFLRSRHVITLAKALGVSQTRDPNEFMDRVIRAITKRTKPCCDCESSRPVYCAGCTRVRVKEAKHASPTAPAPSKPTSSGPSGQGTIPNEPNT